MTVTLATNPRPVEQATDSTRTSTETQAPPASPRSDTAQVSNAALAAAKAAAEEATETGDVTAREARAGDHQAQRLLAKYQAEHAK